MLDIYHDIPMRAPADQVYQAVSTPKGLDTWWTERSSGRPAMGSQYELRFGPGVDWRGSVSLCTPGVGFELQITSAYPDWLGTRVGFSLAEINGATRVRFHHTRWPSLNDHYRVSCYHWALYLRLLKRYVEKGEIVPYEERLDA